MNETKYINENSISSIESHIIRNKILLFRALMVCLISFHCLIANLRVELIKML